MDRTHTQTAVVCLSDVGGAFALKSDAISIARLANEHYAALVEQYPGRFGGFATLPLPHVDEAIEELIYALDTLKLDGVMLLSNIEGLYLGDPKLDPLMAELNNRHAIVFVHPGATEPISTSLHFPGFLLDFVFDTTRAATNMIFNTIPQRYPNIRFIFAHMGGTIPYLVERITLGLLNERRQNSKLPIEKVVNVASKIVPLDVLTEHATHVRSILGNFYYDTALSCAPATVKSVYELAGPGHILYGSDYPYGPEIAGKLTTKLLLEKSDLSEAEKELIEYKNAEELFPHLS
jgi:predicted TIM-barrel fold metal-dependent hydrolase